MPKSFTTNTLTILNELRSVLEQTDIAAVDRLVRALMKARRVFVYGQGRSGHMSRAFATRLMHLGLDVHFVGETTTPPITRRDLCLVNSGTGQTRFVFHVAEAAKTAGAKLATITAHPEARLALMSDIVIVLPAPTKGQVGGQSVSRQPPGSLFEQSLLVALDAIVMILMSRLHLTARTLARRHANIE